MDIFQERQGRVGDIGEAVKRDLALPDERPRPEIRQGMAQAPEHGQRPGRLEERGAHVPESAVVVLEAQDELDHVVPERPVGVHAQRAVEIDQVGGPLEHRDHLRRQSRHVEAVVVEVRRHVGPRVPRGLFAQEGEALDRVVGRVDAVVGAVGVLRLPEVGHRGLVLESLLQKIEDGEGMPGVRPVGLFQLVEAEPPGEALPLQDIPDHPLSQLAVQRRLPACVHADGPRTLNPVGLHRSPEEVAGPRSASRRHRGVPGGPRGSTRRSPACAPA